MEAIVDKEDEVFKQEKKQKDILLSQLPPEILELIWSHLFALDPGALCYIRLVHKDWSSVTRPPRSLINAVHYKFPYLMTLTGSTCKFFHSVYHHTFHFDIPELFGASILYSKQDWLLLYRCTPDTCLYDYFVFNPFTRQKITLSTTKFQFRTIWFSSSPTSSHCRVIGFVDSGTLLGIIRLGEEKWRFYSVFDSKYYVSYCHPVVYKQKVYCMETRGMILVFDLIRKKSYVIGNRLPDEVGDSIYQRFLVADKEELLAVFVPMEQQLPFIMRMDLSKKVWKPVQLNNKMVYVSQAASFLMPSPTKVTSNKIYFPKMRDDDCIFYSVATMKYHSFSGNYSSDLPCNVKEWKNCAWITP